MASSLAVSVVIVSLNGASRIAMPLDALRRCDPAPHEVIVVDNGSSDGLADLVARDYPEVLLVRAPRNLGFAGGNNFGILNASGDVVLLLNDDTEPRADWLGPIVELLRREPGVGIVGCQLVYPDGVTIQHMGGVVHANGLTDHVAWGEDSRRAGGADDPTGPVVECDYATGAAMAIRREVIAEVGLLDEGFWPIYFEEVDFCERARRAGWRCVVAQNSAVVHHESQTTVKFSRGFLEKYHRNRWRYLLRNRGRRGLLRALRAEARWLAQHKPWDMLWPLAQAYAWIPFQYNEIMAERRRAAGEGIGP